jgi:hypothetical protein|uniref:Uncharacterized protein n=1 Tax=Zea mays TaxID=4577 RepID=A0A804QF55_MAIZE
MRTDVLESPGRVVVSSERREKKEDEVCGGEQGVHCGDAGRRHRAQGAGGQALLLGREAGRVAVVGGRQDRRRRRRRGVAKDDHVPQLLGTELSSEAAAEVASAAGQVYN